MPETTPTAKPASRPQITYLIGYVAQGGRFGSTHIDFTLPVTEADESMILRILRDKGEINPVILAISRLAPKRVPAPQD